MWNEYKSCMLFGHMHLVLLRESERRGGEGRWEGGQEKNGVREKGKEK